MVSTQPIDGSSTASNGQFSAADIAMLTTLLAQQSADAQAALSDLDIAEELHRIEAAQGIAEGMEDRLDGLIGNLDRLLETLQSIPSANEQTTAQQPDTAVTGSSTVQSPPKDGSTPKNAT